MTTHATTFIVPVDLDATRWSTLEPLYRTLIERDITSALALEQLILDRSELDAAVSEVHANLHIAMTCHTDDEAAKQAYLGFVDQVLPDVLRTGFELDQKLAGSPFVGALESPRYDVLVRDTTADVEIFREKNVALQTEDTKLGQQYREICGEMTVEFKGEERTLPQMSRFIEETDRDVREAAWRATVERRYADHERLHDLFETMIGIRHDVAVNAGLSNYRDYMFKEKHRFDYTPEDCEAFHAAAETVCVPLLRQLNAERATALGVDSLRPWDLATDVLGRAPLRPFQTTDELLEGTSRLFTRMSPDLGTLFDQLRDGTSFDLDSRKGKAPGGYQMNRDRQRKPFIFMNASGMQRDLETMVHEAGHAFHSLLCKDDPLLHYRHAPHEFAEVASMSMEFLAFPYLDEFYADEAEANRARRGQLENLVTLLPWIATIDAFQHWVYTHPDHTREARTRCWNELGDRFGAAVSWEGIEHFRAVGWQRQLHVYELPFYYIEYGIAQLGAVQLWLHSLENAARAIDRYRQALSLGGSRPLPELFGAADLRFDFSTETMRTLMDRVRSELQGLPA